MRNLPSIVSALERVIRFINRLSYRLTRWLLTPLAYWLQIPLEEALPRASLTGGLSILIAMLISLFLDRGFAWLHLVLPTLYGAFIGWRWDELEYPEGIWLGEER